MISSLLLSKLGPQADGQPSSNNVKDKYQLKHVEENVELMRNRVQILRKQLQKEKESIQRHKSLTDQTVQQKLELQRISSIKRRDKNMVEQQISSLKARNYSYRECHKMQMSNILKALYMVKMDDAQQIKNASMENKKSLQKMNENYYQEQKEKKRQLLEQSERAKERYIGYWKSKLSEIYNENQKKLQQNSIVAEQRKRELEMLQLHEMNLLEEINLMRTKDAQAKKEYAAALSLKNKEVLQAVRDQRLGGSVVLKRDKEPILVRSQSNGQKMNDFFTKSPIVSFMSSSNVKVPRANVNQNKLHGILRQLRRQRRREVPQQQENY